ncbi:MAG: 6-phosphogluconolactonase [Candidatus Dormibacter sp.]
MSVDTLPGTVRVLTDPIAVAAAVAQWVSEQSARCNPFRIALAGGSTPQFLYEALASSTFKAGIDWSRWQVYFSDERAAPPDHHDSNYRLVHDTLLLRAPVPPGQIHRIEADGPDLDAAAAAYSRLLEADCGRPPRLDVVLLGLGADGHTASLFPGTPALDVVDAWTTRGRADFEPLDRVTMTFPAINAAAHIAFQVTGSEKGDALRGVVDGSVPAARVRAADGELLWFLDAAAAGTLR